MPTDSPVSCISCGAPLRDAGAPPSYRPCQQCGTLHLRPLPSHESNEAFESAETARSMAAIDDARAGYFARRLRLLHKAARASGTARPRLLDVGCSTGRLMAAANADGWDVTGIEMAKNLAREARNHNPGAQVITGDILQMDVEPLGRFEAITALDVIEHVLDPPAFLHRLVAMQPAGGQLLLQTPNAASLRARLHGSKWNMRIPEYHFHLFTPDGLAGLLSRNGYQVSHLSTASGSGRERGLPGALAAVKESALQVGMLGNALVVVAQKSR